MKSLWWVAGVIVVAAAALLSISHYKPAMQQPEVKPISHASLALLWQGLTVYADPVGNPSLYASLPRPDIILITHVHPDHFSTSTLEALMSSSTTIVAPQSVAQEMPADLAAKTQVLNNPSAVTLKGLNIEAIPAYNLRPEAQMYHPKSRGDNGYVLEKNGVRVYIAGDTEGTPEMRALKNIDIAFIPMNLPYTMSVQDAADAVLAFKPKTVYPYHYQGTDGLSDIHTFKSLVNAGDPNIDVMLANWYPGQ